MLRIKDKIIEELRSIGTRYTDEHERVGIISKVKTLKWVLLQIDEIEKLEKKR